MTPKNPVYWRTKDGRKVVHLGMNSGYNRYFDVNTDTVLYIDPDTLTEWKEPVIKTVYIHWHKDETFSVHNTNTDPNYIKATKKITITEGEFDE